MHTDTPRARKNGKRKEKQEVSSDKLWPNQQSERRGVERSEEAPAVTEKQLPRRRCCAREEGEGGARDKGINQNTPLGSADTQSVLAG